MTQVATNTAWAHGLAGFSPAGDLLDVWYPEPKLGAAPRGDSAWIVSKQLDELAGVDSVTGTERKVIRTEIDLSIAVTSTADAYLRLHLLSHLLIRPNGLNLDDLIPNLPMLAFTTRGPMRVSDFKSRQQQLLRQGVALLSLDRFPRLLDYVVPDRVRIADAQRVRLGAHLAPGTVVMHEGFVNFNAGTLGESMVEGRISQGVVVGPGSDIGGGASIMGTLSGGGKHRVSIGSRCLIGANAGIGVSIGDDCVIEAGLYLTAGTKLQLISDAGNQQVKASELSGQSGLLFRRNSLSGAVEALPRKAEGVELNPQLH
ncbi:MAG: 2,3,4,5-tetrahydropyridine-2,6-dicarboxylate N-succinyltransferase [Actinomycetota bacterium]